MITDIKSSEYSPASVPQLDKDSGEGSDELQQMLRQYWYALLRRRWLIIAVIVAFVAAGTIYTMLQPSQFTAGTRIEISRGTKNITNVQGIDKEADPYDAEFYDTQYALLKAPSLAERVVNKYNLGTDAGFFLAHGMSVPSSKPGQSAQALRIAQDQAAARLLLSGILIKPVKNSSLVDISYTSRSASWSARIANLWPLEFIGANVDRKLASTADARNMLEDRLATLRVKLEESENRLIAYGNGHDIIILSSTRGADGKTTESRSLVASNLEVMNTALMVARADRIAAQSRAHGGGGASSTEALQSSTIGGLRSKRAELSAEYARLMVQFEPGYPAAVAVKRQIEVIDGTIARETARVNGGRQVGYAEALQREQALASDVENLTAQYRQQQKNNVQYNIYQREVDTNRQLYDGLLQRYKEIGIAGTVDPSNIVVVDDAKTPGGPSGPNLPRNILVSILLGLAAAGFVIFILEQLDDAIRSPQDIEQRLHVPLLGAIPSVAGGASDGLLDVKSALMEAYFSVRAALALTTSHGFPKSLAVTSAQPAEGKSTTAFALAAILARMGRRVLIIDADMRSPSIHGLANVANDLGLSNLLSGSDDFEHLVVQSGIEGLYVLPAGPTPPSAAELLSSDRLALVFRRLEKEFDHLIMDCPPVIGLADAPLLVRVVEGCIFVIASSQTSLANARQALNRVKQGHSQVFGAVATKVDVSRFGYGRYSDAYSYGESGSSS